MIFTMLINKAEELGSNCVPETVLRDLKHLQTPSLISEVSAHE